MRAGQHPGIARHSAPSPEGAAARMPSGDLCLSVMETPNAPNPDAPAPPGTAVDVNRRLAACWNASPTVTRRAFAEFYELTSRRVFGMARRVLIDPELSEDATQEVFLQVWQNAAKFNRRSRQPAGMAHDHLAPAGRGQGPLLAVIQRPGGQIRRRAARTSTMTPSRMKSAAGWKPRPSSDAWTRSPRRSSNPSGWPTTAD